IFGVFVWPLSTYTENTYKAVTSTKLINYHAIEDSVIVNDKGSVVTTRTIAYDASTGSSIVTKTANEFNDPIYNVTYPAWWAYSGEAPAYGNIGMRFDSVSFNKGRITNLADLSVFESGDELQVTNTGSPGCGPTATGQKLWVFDANKNTTAL